MEYSDKKPGHTDKLSETSSLLARLFLLITHHADRSLSVNVALNKKITVAIENFYSIQGPFLDGGVIFNSD